MTHIEPNALRYIDAMPDQKPSDADAFARISIPADSPRRAARHGSIEEIRDNVFFVRGRMLSTPKRPLFERLFVHYSRSMTLVRTISAEGEFELTLFNAIRLNDRALENLGKLGKIKHVVRLGSFHGVDDDFYLKQFGAKYWIAEGMIPPPGQPEPCTPLSEDAAADQPITGARAFIFERLPYPEAIYVLPAQGGEPGLAISTDSIQNHDSIWNRDNSLMVSFGITRIGLKGSARLGPIWLRQQAPGIEPPGSGAERWNEISQFFRPQFERLLTDFDFDALAPGHGVPILRGAKEAVRASLNQQLRIPDPNG